jgi:hypothetical protein
LKGRDLIWVWRFSNAGRFSQGLVGLALRPTSVDAEDLVINDDTQRQKVKHICEVMPYVGITVLARALSVESIGLGDATRFVVPAD